MNKDNFITLPAQSKINAFTETAAKKALPAVAVEKDWWVTAILRALFSLSYFEHLSFKGGTSLSKCWGLIERFSEDIDIAVNRDYLGFAGTLSKTQISDRLRRAACSFVRETLQFDIKNHLEMSGITTNHFSVYVNITPVTTADPEIVEIEYQSLFDDNDYIKPIVKIEVSGRSMSEPVQTVKLQSMVDEVFPDMPFTNAAFDVNAVVPQRTFIEKICLLHEEFAKPQEFIRIERMSRHLYDLARIMDTPIADESLANKQLYNSITEHRRIFVGLKGFDYSTLAPQSISIVPPAKAIDQWKEDYETMRRTMIYGKSLSFDVLIDKIKQLNERINRIDW
ncbi:MAG: nucleotidyl transferase AbiEii/AbiGii toxin family protein [Dysgonamonadaceae bacterium]|jgi:predicted nucleotidyltransferase component of viral defense system|nr:nucleotidyl transferase AbiEii/AbiGii toxin family protein [Dysgonamonadaceae bacterium]